MNLRLRIASSTEIEPEMKRVLEFFKRYPHQQVRERAPEVLKDAIDRSSLLLLEDQNGDLQGTCAQIHHGNGMYSETGAVRILVNGFGLQSIMMAICAINEYIFSPPTGYIFSITSEDNEPSLKNISRAGFVQSNPDEKFLNTVGYGTEFPPSKRFFRFSAHHSGEIRNKLLKLASSRLITRGERSLLVIPEHPLFRKENLQLLEQI